MKLKVTSFKPNGTIYTQEINEVSFNNYDDIVDFKNKVAINDKSVKNYSGIANGFVTEFTYHIELLDSNLFLNYLVYSKDNKIGDN